MQLNQSVWYICIRIFFYQKYLPGSPQFWSACIGRTLASDSGCFNLKNMRQIGSSAPGRGNKCLKPPARYIWCLKRRHVKHLVLHDIPYHQSQVVEKDLWNASFFQTSVPIKSQTPWGVLTYSLVGPHAQKDEMTGQCYLSLIKLSKADIRAAPSLNKPSTLQVQWYPNSFWSSVHSTLLWCWHRHACCLKLLWQDTRLLEVVVTAKSSLTIKLNCKETSNCARKKLTNHAFYTPLLSDTGISLSSECLQETNSNVGTSWNIQMPPETCSAARPFPTFDHAEGPGRRQSIHIFATS